MITRTTEIELNRTYTQCAAILFPYAGKATVHFHSKCKGLKLKLPHSIILPYRVVRISSYKISFIDKVKNCFNNRSILMLYVYKGE